jgi:hypothetical protein
MTKHVVMFSGGLGSWATAKRVAAEHGTTNLFLVFADVGGDHSNPHEGEDEDTYRFIKEAAAEVGGELVWLTEGRTIWQVYKDTRFLGNSRLAVCSRDLKQIPCHQWLDANCDPESTVVYVGIDWTESHRLPAIVSNYLPYKAEAPLTEAPYTTKEQIKAECVAAGIAIPRAYLAGATHNNCGMFCVRAGQGPMANLLQVNPERYAYHEAKEQELREYLDADVSILRDRTGGTSTPLTLRRFRERIQLQPSLFDEYDVGGCGCFVALGATIEAGDFGGAS